MILDSIHFKLRDLENRIVTEVSHIHRLNLATLASPFGYTSTQKQLTEAVGSNYFSIESQ